MKKIIYAILVLCALGSLSAKQLINGNIKYILFDVSKSMRGEGDGNGIDILAEVKEVMQAEIIATAESGDFILFMPFDKKIHPENSFQLAIYGDNEKKIAKMLVDNVKAEGLTTHLSASIMAALDKAKQLKDEYDFGPTSTIELYIFTDGLGNGPGDRGNTAFDDFIRAYQVLKSDYPYLFTHFIMLGSHSFDPLIQEKFQAEDIQVTTTSRATIKAKKTAIKIIKANNVKKQIAKIDSLKVPNSQEAVDTPRQAYTPDVVSSEKSSKKHINIIPKAYILTNKGKIRVLLSQDVDDLIATKINVINEEKLLEYTVAEREIIVTGQSLSIEIVPQDKKQYNTYRDKIEKPKILKIYLQFESQDERYEFRPDKFLIKVMVKPDYGFLPKIW